MCKYPNAIRARIHGGLIALTVCGNADDLPRSNAGCVCLSGDLRNLRKWFARLSADQSANLLHVSWQNRRIYFRVVGASPASHQHRHQKSKNEKRCAHKSYWDTEVGARMASRIPWSNFLSAGTIVASAPLSFALPLSTK